MSEQLEKYLEIILRNPEKKSVLLTLGKSKAVQERRASTWFGGKQHLYGHNINISHSKLLCKDVGEIGGDQ